MISSSIVDFHLNVSAQVIAFLYIIGLFKALTASALVMTMLAYSEQCN